MSGKGRRADENVTLLDCGVNYIPKFVLVVTVLGVALSLAEIPNETIIESEQLADDVD